MDYSVRHRRVRGGETYPPQPMTRADQRIKRMIERYKAQSVIAGAVVVGAVVAGVTLSGGGKPATSSPPPANAVVTTTPAAAAASVRHCRPPSTSLRSTIWPLRETSGSARPRTSRAGRTPATGPTAVGALRTLRSSTRSDSDPIPHMTRRRVRTATRRRTPHPAFGGEKVYLFGNSCFIDNMSVNFPASSTSASS